MWAGAAHSGTVAPSYLAVLAISAVSAVLVALVGTTVTAGPATDVVWLLLLGGLVPIAATLAARESLLVLTALAGVLSTGGVQLAAGVALAATVIAVVARLERPGLDAAVGAVGINALLRTDQVLGSTAITVLAGALAIAFVVVTALPKTSERTRRLVTRAALGAVVLCGIAGGVAAATVLAVRGDLETGISQAQRGLELAASGDADAARERFTAAESTLRDGHRRLTRPWMQPALALPVVGPNLRATAELTDSGTTVAASAREVIEVADPAALIDGTRVDLDALVEARPRLVDAHDSLTAALATAERVRSPWLLTPLVSRIDDLEPTLIDAHTTAGNLVHVSEVAPAMLGASSPRAYLLLLTTPSESRGLSGFVGNWGLLEADDGAIRLARTGRIRALSEHPDRDQRTISGNEEFLARYDRYRPTRFLQNITASPDFPTVAQIAVELYPQADLPELDGVILADPAAIAALVSVTGPVEVPGIDRALAADDIEQFLLHDQYLIDGRTRITILDELFHAVFDRLASEGPDPARVTEAFAPVIRSDRLLFWSTDPDEAALLHQLGVDGAFPRIDHGEDLLSVRTANTNPNKIDYFLQRDITYEATVHPATGDLSGTVTVGLHNHAVDDPGLPAIVLNSRDMKNPRAWNRQWVTIYTPHDLDDILVDGEPVDAEHLPELGVNAYSLYVDIPPSSRLVIEATVTGQVDAADYRLRWAGQPTARPDEVVFDVDLGSRTIGVATTTDEDLDLEPGARR